MKCPPGKCLQYFSASIIECTSVPMDAGFVRRIKRQVFHSDCVWLPVVLQMPHQLAVTEGMIYICQIWQQCQSQELVKFSQAAGLSEFSYFFISIINRGEEGSMGRGETKWQIPIYPLKIPVKTIPYWRWYWSKFISDSEQNYSEPKPFGRPYIDECLSPPLETINKNIYLLLIQP